MGKKLSKQDKNELEELLKEIQKKTVLSSNIFYNLHIRGANEIFLKNHVEEKFIDLFEKLIDYKYLQPLFVNLHGETISIGFSPLKRIQDESWINVTNLAELLFHKEMRYKAYLQTNHWIAFSNMAKKTAEYKCQECGIDNGILSVHHLNYKCKGEERLEDVQVLCRSCHYKKHKFSIKKKGC